MRIFLDFHSRVPIYEQIKEQIITFVGQGVLNPEDQLPPLRQLSSELSVNINTIKRALSELEGQGIVYSVAGKGIFISDNAQKNTIVKRALEETSSAVSRAKAMGVSKDQIIIMVNKIYEGDETLD